MVATACTSHGTIAIGITTIAHGTTVGTIPGTTDGMTHIIACGDGLTTDITVGTHLTGMVAITMVVTMVVEKLITTDILATQVRLIHMDAQAIVRRIATAWLPTVSVWVA